MSIKSTRQITRSRAIDRISAIGNLILLRDYKAIDNATDEDADDLQNFVDNGIDFDIGIIDQWTDQMIEDKLDEPFFRYSMFDNYLLDT